MRSELNRVGNGYQLTYDTTGSIGNYPLAASVGPGAADAIFVMGYDYRTASAGAAGSIDPLSGPRYDLTDTVRAYTARVSPSRIILGLPWYGRAWSTTTDEVRAPTRDNGAKYGYSSAANYESVVDLVDQHGRRWDSLEQSPYVVYRRENCTSTYGCVTTWRQLYYEDGASLKLRLAMVNDYDLRGAGMWALGYDGGHAELYRAYAESFARRQVGAPGGDPRARRPTRATRASWSPGRPGTTSPRTTSRCRGRAARGPAGCRGTTATSEVWLGRDGAGYAFRVRARDGRGNVGRVERELRVRRDAVAAPRRASAGSPPTAWRTAPARARSRRGSARSPRARSWPSPAAP